MTDDAIVGENMNHYDDIIQNITTLYSLDPTVIKAIITIESSGNTWAMRYEPEFYKSIVIKFFSLSVTELVARATSWGLMQILGQVARELGYGAKFLSGLCQPEVGIKYGCLKFKQQLDRYGGHIDQAVSAYNAGSAIMKDGKFGNQAYVDKFHRTLNDLT